MKKYILTVITITALSISFSGTVTAQTLPLYISSVIENATPAGIDITYDSVLANIVPAPSAFTVMVNSVTRSVNSVAISGNNVQLTLSNPVVYGDIITFSYTRPAINPLQTPEGGLAASLTTRNVINNVAAGIFLTPTVGTSVVTAIASTSATITSNVISDGGAAVIARGVCWNTSGSPTIAGNHTSDGTGTGSFTSLMTGLVPNTTYYVRAYATNSEGTAYGPELSLNTCPAAPTIGTISQPTCEVATGSVVLTGLPIRGMFQWTITISPGGTTYTGFGDNTTIPDLAAGTYNFTVSIAGCVSPASADVVINPQPAPLNATLNFNDVQCNGANDGEIWISSPSGGSGSYEYTLNGGSSWQTETIYLGLALGTYNVQIRDASSPTCIVVLNNNLVLTEPEVMAATVTSSDATCFGANDGTITIENPTGGSGNYLFTYIGNEGWSESGNFTNVSPGTYNVQIRDANVESDCIVTLVEELVIGEPAALYATPSSTNVLCFGGSDGAIDLTVDGGTMPYIFLWNNGATTEDLTGLTAGTYTCVVTDANGCTADTIAIVDQPAAPLEATAIVQNVFCYGGNGGHINLTVTGGTPPYTYLWNTGSTSEDLYDLVAGTYTVTITDNNGCSIVHVVNVTQPDILDATVTSSNPTCYGSSDGTITLSNPTGGTGAISGYEGAYEYSINDGESWISPGNFTNLAAGFYNVLIRDTEIYTCIVTLATDLELTEPEMLSATVSSTDATCFGASDGTITIENPTGGSGNYLFTYSGNEGWSESGNFTNVPPGTYYVQIRDANVESDCIVTLAEDLVITQPEEINVDEIITNVSCNSCKDGAIDISVTGGTGGYSSAWTGPDGFTMVAEDLVALKPGSYNLTITDANACISESTYEVFNPFIVTNTNDDGIGSLRYAIQYANDHQTVTPDTITFSIPGAGPFTILPQTSLPVISDPIFIDGFSQLGTDAAAAKLSIEIAGVITGAYTSGLQLAGGNSTIRGLVINRFRSEIRITSDRNKVYGNFIGTDITGSTGFELYTGTNTGISIYQGSDNIIGGETPIERNIISALTDGISLNTANNNNIIGNYIGLDVTGKNPLGNSSRGINLIGSSENHIGGASPGTGNTIVSDGYGIYLDNSVRNTFKGNFIGVDASGTRPMENSGTGLFVSGGSSENIIGGANTGEGNVISGNEIGIWIYGDVTHGVLPSNNNKVLGNLIGTDLTGTVPIGNSDCGVLIVSGSSGNQIGGMEKGEGNIIANSPKYGIWVFGENGDYPLNNLISCNSIYNNGRIGIDHGTIRLYDGVTPNDPGDIDQGPNNFQNFPVLESLRFSQGSVTINGSLNSAANTEYLLQFFANKIGDESMYGEGQKYIGSANVTTNASGNATFTETFPVYSSWGDTFTATATDPQGNTSEFSHVLGGLKEQVVAAADWPLHYSINKDGLPKVPETSTVDIDAINAAFKTWTDITTSTVEFIGDGTTDLKYAGIDSINLVSFVDDQFDFGTGVLAVAAKTTEVDQNDLQIRIIDADIIFNPHWVNNIEYSFGIRNDELYDGYFDIQSVATHEIGHILGLIHSGIPGSSMFFMMDSGIFVRTLANDDIAWASYRYPESNYSSTYGSISGTITYGYSPENDPQPVAGALIKAINTDLNIKYRVHSYSDADGTYHVPGLIPGNYDVFIEPLDGDVQGFNLKPQNISPYLYEHTVYVDYPGEYYNEFDAAVNEDNLKSSIAVLSGIQTAGKDLITNKDLTPPYVVSVSPADTILDFDIVKDITVRFSEAIDINTLTDETCYLEYSDGVNTVKHYGDITPVGNGTNIVLFNPKSVLRYSTDYAIYLTDGVRDLKENSLVPFMSTFTTMDADSEAPEITYVIPADGADSVFVTEVIRLSFSEPMDKSTVEAAFALTWDEGSPAVLHEVEGSYQWDNNSMIMTFAPLRSLSEAAEYTITVSETAEDLGGNLLAAAQSFTFETVPSAPPQIIYLGPADAATGVTVETPVVVDFSEPVNPETVSSETFKLTPAGGTQVSGTFDFLNDNSRVVFRPDADLSFNTGYTIEITTGIEDVSQPAMGMEGTSTTVFTTASQITTPHIRYLEPSAGITGSVVLISGTGFDPDPANNRVTFNGIQTYVKNATLTELITTVPNGVMSGPVTVTVNGVVSANTMHFDVIPESLDPCSDVIANTSTGTQTTHDVDIRADCAYAYVTNPEDNTVSVVDLDPDSPGVVATINVGTTPVKIDIDPQGTKAYVSNYNSHDVSVIDISDENGALAEVVNTIKVGIEPYGIAVTPDGKRVYVANHYSENLSIIDVDPTSGGFDHVVANVSTGSGTTSVEISGECALAVVTGDFGVKIVSADPEDTDYNSVIATVSSGTKTREVDISGEAGLAIVTTDEGNLLVINLYPEGADYSDAVVANVATGTQVSDVEISGDCMFVYVTDTQNGNVLVYKFTQTGTGIPDGSYIAGLTLELHNTIEVGTFPIGLAIDDKAERLFITDGDDLGRRVTEIRICCGPITPTTELSELIMIIQNLITYGGIKESQGISLIKKCNDALANIYGGKPKTAINNLNAFIDMVKEYIAGGKISSDQGNELIVRAKAIIAMLKITKSAETGLLYEFNEFAKEEDLASESGLGVIYPNPFSESVVINYKVATGDPGTAKVLIRVFDLSGRLIATVADLDMQPGYYTVQWDGKNNNDERVLDGTYIIHFRAGIAEDVKEIILIK